MEKQIEFLNQKSSQLLAYLVQSGNGGHTTPIVKFFDKEGEPPTEKNNWLFNEDGDEISGSFRNSDSQVFDFLLSKEDDGNWTRSFIPSKIFDNNVD